MGSPVVRAALALALALGFSPTASAYTLKETTSGATVHWASDPVELVVDASLTEAFGEEARTALAMAADGWRGPVGPRFVIVEGGPGAEPHDARDRVNGVYVLDHWPWDLELLAVTAATYDGTTGRMVDADVLVNGRHDLRLLDAPGSEDAHDLAAVLAHELGHVLGLDESPGARGATMYPEIQPGEIHQRFPSDDDRAGVAAIYADRALPPPGGCGPARVASGTPPLSWALFGLLLGAWTQRRRRRTRG